MIEAIKLIERFAGTRVTVVGDVMLDRYLSGPARRLNREAPVPIVDIEREEEFAGGAANTAVNLARLGGRPTLLGMIGDDREGQSLSAILEKQGIGAKSLLARKNRRTLTKQRISAQGHMLVRFDYGSGTAPTMPLQRFFIKALRQLYPSQDAVIVADYGYGVVAPAVLEELARLQSRHHKVLFIDSKHPEDYRHMHPTVTKPNYQECMRLLKIRALEKGDRAQQVRLHEKELFEKTGASIVAVTLDTEGSVVFSRRSPPYRTHTSPQSPAKAAGAGDTYAAAFTLALAQGAEASASADVASAAASIVVCKEGTATCSADELQKFFSVQHKQTTVPLLEKLVQDYRRQGKTIVFTNGCFDILHSGHVQYLNIAKKLGDVLVVGLNSDSSVTRLKGPERPINPATSRAKVLAGLGCVDHIAVFKEDTPVDLVRRIRPDVYVKGGDYTREMLPEAPVVETYGGRVEIVPLVPGQSTTNIIKHVQKHGIHDLP